MAVEYRLRIVCDVPGCARPSPSVTGASPPRVTRLRAMLTQGSWRRVFSQDRAGRGYDLCPEHRQWEPPTYRAEGRREVPRATS
jgi:hypothetical protein